MSISASQIGAFAQMSPRARADALYQASQSEMRSMLWNAALGEANTTPDDQSGSSTGKSPFLDLLAMATALTREQASPSSANQAPALTSAFSTSPASPTGSQNNPDAAPTATGPLQLGSNARYASTVTAASERTGIPPSALAAIIDAEAAKNTDGSWNAASRNPFSSARGLTQFLTRTWVGEAERSGTFLNNLARANNWLTDNGKVRSDCRSTLLSLRLDSRCSIEAAADYAKANVAHLQEAGIKIGSNPAQFAQLAYLGHQLGAHDAVSFLNGQVSEARSRQLLVAQVGNKEASRRIQEAGDPTVAHRNWLANFVDKHVDPWRFVRNS